MGMGEVEAVVWRLMFPGVCLVLGLVLDWVRVRMERRLFKVPSTVFILLVVTLAGLMVRLVLRDLDSGHLLRIYMDLEAKVSWKKEKPGEVMGILLPILIFDSSFHMEAHEFTSRLGWIGALASVGFLASSVLVAAGLLGLMGGLGGRTDWEPSWCLLYGALVSATDPVAVVALLEELGAPLYVKVLIDGEALLNDAAAIILFHGLEEMILHGAAPMVFLSLALKTCLSGVLGYLVARLTVTICSSSLCPDLWNHLGWSIVNIFGIYNICDGFEGSGVVAVVVLGVTMSSRKEEMRRETVDLLHDTWGMMAFWANCIIFVLSGILVAESFIPRPQSRAAAAETGAESQKDFLLLMLMGSVGAYVLSVVSRAAVFALVGGLARRWQQRRRRPVWPVAHLGMMVWGGLRGAVALLLAFKLKAAVHHAKLERAELVRLVMCFTAATVLLSLLIQGSSFEKLAQWTELNKASQRTIKRINEQLRSLRRKGKQAFVRQREEWELADEGALWHLLRRTTQPKGAGGGGTEELLNREPPSQLEGAGSDEEFASAHVSTASDLSDVSPSDQAGRGKEELMEYLELLRQTVLGLWEQARLSRRTLRRLLHACERAEETKELRSLTELLAHPGSLTPLLKCLQPLARLVVTKCEALLPISTANRLARDVARVLLCALSTANLILFLFDWIWRAEHHKNHFRDIQPCFFFHIVVYVVSLCLLPLQGLELPRRRDGGWSWGVNKRPMLLRLEMWVELFFTLLFSVNVVLIVVAYVDDRCLKPTDNPNVVHWDDHVIFCHRSRVAIMAGTGVRAIIGFPISFLTIVVVLARALIGRWEHEVSSQLATINAFILISETLPTSFLRLLRVRGEGKNRREALKSPSTAQTRVLTLNLKARQMAYKTLAQRLVSAEDLEMFRFAQTKQAALHILHKVAEDVETMKEKGRVAPYQTEASSKLSEAQELQRRLDEGKAEVGELSIADFRRIGRPRPDLHTNAGSIRRSAKESPSSSLYRSRRKDGLSSLLHWQLKALGFVQRLAHSRQEGAAGSVEELRPEDIVDRLSLLLKPVLGIDNSDVLPPDMPLAFGSSKNPHIFFLSEGLCLQIKDGEAHGPEKVRNKNYVHMGSFVNLEDVLNEGEDSERREVKTFSACRVFQASLKDVQKALSTSGKEAEMDRDVQEALDREGYVEEAVELLLSLPAFHHVHRRVLTAEWGPKIRFLREAEEAELRFEKGHCETLVLLRGYCQDWEKRQVAEGFRDAPAAVLLEDQAGPPGSGAPGLVKVRATDAGESAAFLTLPVRLDGLATAHRHRCLTYADSNASPSVVEGLHRRPLPSPVATRPTPPTSPNPHTGLPPLPPPFRPPIL